ncbi:hypothetical protein Bca4012_068286 [Brassica carinata]
MSDSPQSSLSGSLGHCASNNEPSPGPFPIDLNPESQTVASPELLTFSDEITRSPTLTLPDGYKIPDTPPLTQKNFVEKPETSIASARAEELSKLSSLEICKYSELKNFILKNQ